MSQIFLGNDIKSPQKDQRQSMYIKTDQMNSTNKNRKSMGDDLNQISSSNMKTPISQFNLDPKSEQIQEIESFMPLYLDSQSVDVQYLQWCYERLKQKQVECSLKNDIETLNYIQQRVQVLVYQNPLPQISQLFRSLLQSENIEEQSMSRYFLNEDFPSIIQLQHILFSNDHSQPNEISQKISDILKRNSDLFSNSKQSNNMNNQSAENLDFSTESSTDIQLQQDVLLSAVLKEELHKQKVYSTDNITLEDLQKLLTNIYNTFNGRIPNIFRPFLFFPEYLKTFFSSFELTFIEPSAWPYESLYQIAMMTASAYECSYVFLMFGELYQIYGGNTAFLQEGFESLDPKVQKAWDLIYLLKESHPSQILNQDCSNTLFNYLLNETPTWNQNELIFAFLSISFAQQLVILSDGMGFVGDNYSTANSGKSSSKPSNSSSVNQIKLNEKITNEVIQILSNIKPVDINYKDEHDPVEEAEAFDFDQLTSQINQNRFRKYIGSSSIFSNEYPQGEPCSFTSLYSSNSNDKTSSKLKRNRQHMQLSSDVCNWKTHTSAFIAQRNKKLSKTLNEKYSQIQELTLKNFGTAQQVDTGLFRQAIWNFCEVSMGYTKPDFNYKKMNTLLQKPFRNLLKKIIFNPHELKLSDINSIPYLFEAHDVVHIIFLASESKFYAQNNFLFHCLQQFLQ